MNRGWHRYWWHITFREHQNYVIWRTFSGSKSKSKGKTPKKQKSTWIKSTQVATLNWSTYWSIIDMANGICRARQSLFLLDALLSVISGMCFDTLVFECDRPFYRRVIVASQTAYCDGVICGYTLLKWYLTRSLPPCYWNINLFVSCEVSTTLHDYWKWAWSK